MRQTNSISLAATGQTRTTTVSTSAGGALPNCSDGTLARYYRLAATGTCYFRFGTNSTPTAVNTDCMVLPGAPLIVERAGFTHYAVIDDGVSVKFNITPLEDS